MFNKKVKYDAECHSYGREQKCNEPVFDADQRLCCYHVIEKQRIRSEIENMIEEFRNSQTTLDKLNVFCRILGYLTNHDVLYNSYLFQENEFIAELDNRINQFAIDLFSVDHPQYQEYVQIYQAYKTTLNNCLNADKMVY
jgi:hypothetical protein